MGWLGIASVEKWRSCSAALLAYANDALDTAVRSVRVQKENFWSVSENQPFSKHVILGGLMSGGRLSGGLTSGGRLSGGRLSGGQWTIDVEGGSCADDTGCSTSVLSERHISEWRTERATHYMDDVRACDTTRDRHAQTSERSRTAQAWQIIAACVSEGLWISWPKCTRHESAMYCEMSKLVYFVRGVNYM